MVSTKAATAAEVSELERARGREQAAYLSIRVLAVAAIAFVVITSFQARPAPGGQGEALGVAVGLIVFCSATVAAMWLTQAGSAVQLAVLVIAVVSAAALIGLQGNGAAFLGVFPAVCLAALVLSVRLSALVAGVAAAAVSAAWLANGRALIAGIVLNDFAILAFFLLSLFARRLRESNQRAELLLGELEQTRAAQAQAAALAERQRLAREMHDVLAHSLSGLVLNLEGARLLAAQGGADSQVGEAIDRAHRLAKTGLEEARRAIGMLRDDALPGPERLADLAAEFEAGTCVPCKVAVTGGGKPDLGTGYLTKDASAGEIREALERVTSGQAAIDPAVQQHLVNAIATGPSTAATPQLPAGLTQREAEVLALIAQGLSNIEIADRLVISETTVKSHVNHLFAKIGVRDRAQAVTYAYQHGLT